MIANLQTGKTPVISCGLVAALLILTPLSTAGASDNDPKQQPRELGKINWLRDFDQAVAAAKKADKPMLVLFQEVPGCQTCIDYGRDVLSHPLIVDAADLFVPVAVYNNIKGDDERILKSFSEPSWNNPVVRIMKHDRTSLTQRVAKDYTVAGLAGAMAESLQAVGTDIPSWLKWLAVESAARKHGVRRATFCMHCFWVGEATLGTTEGVISTNPGFIGKDEVVEVEFDPAVISFKKLLAQAKAGKCADRVYARTDEQQSIAADVLGDGSIRTDDQIRVDKEPKYYLAQTPYRFLPMTLLQAARVNAAIGAKQDPTPMLSPGQRALMESIKRHPLAGWSNAIGKAFVPAWQAASAMAAKSQD
ncbi:MAG: VPGUxxT family thioredoxin-like (seleno)protein, type 2 [Planctomycetota bacterium]|jgi:hypothetical protein